MRYVSTRGTAPVLGFTDALLAGLATDGGLYVPEVWPSMPERVPGSTYAERAAQIIQLFVGDDLPVSTVLRLCNEAYGTFAHQSVVPLVQLDHHHFVMELFHGPTLAFKDVALQLVFTDRAAHDAYQVAPRHATFIAENRDNWAQVRVFDAHVSG